MFKENQREKEEGKKKTKGHTIYTSEQIKGRLNLETSNNIMHFNIIWELASPA